MSLNEGTYLQSKWLNWYKGTSVGSPIATVYIALFTTTPANDGTGGTEVSGGSYARQGLSGSGGWTAPASSNPTNIKNNTTVNFPTATANWGTVVGIGLYDASTSGNLLWVGSLASSVVINSGDVLQISANALVLNVNGNACPTGQQTNRLQFLRNFSFYSTIATMYLAAFTTTPALDGTGGTEVSGGSYARLAITPSSFWAALSGATPTVLANASTITFATATADWGTVLSIGLFSASSGGTMHALWTLSSSIIVKNGHILTINASNLSLSEG